MNRPIVKLHTIAQWMEVDPGVRSVILQNIRLKDRLEKWLELRNAHPTRTVAEWVPCSRCLDSEYKGLLLVHPRAPGIHPSQLGSPCSLKIYWEMEGKEQRERHKPRDYLTFDIGHAVHHMMQTYGLQGAWGDQYEAEVRITDGKQPLASALMVEGAADAENILVIDNIPNAPIFEVGLVHEYKSIKKENFAKLTRPKPEHKQQATIYAKMLDRPVVVYLYFCKNDSAMVDYPVEFDSAIWDPVERRAADLVQMFNAETPPPPNPGYHCTQCSYLWMCDAGRLSQRR